MCGKIQRQEQTGHWNSERWPGALVSTDMKSRKMETLRCVVALLRLAPLAACVCVHGVINLSHAISPVVSPHHFLFRDILLSTMNAELTVLCINL